MDFRNALKALYEGYKVRLPEWGGYWYVSKNTGLILVFTCNDTIEDSPWFDKYVNRTDWEIIHG